MAPCPAWCGMRTPSGPARCGMRIPSGPARRAADILSRFRAPPLDENRIAVFVGPVALGFELFIHPLQHVRARKRPQQLVMTGAALMRAGDQCIDDAQSCSGTDSLGCETFSRPPDAVEAGGMLERAHDRRSHGDHTSAPGATGHDGACRRRWNAVWLVEGKTRVDLRVSRGRDAGCVGDGGETRAAPPEGLE